MHKVFIFGNPDLPQDSLPVLLLPRLRQKFPEIDFILADPNEEWDIPEILVAIDTAYGIEDVTLFTDLQRMQPAPRLTMHDFDALANLRLLQKLGKLKKIKIIGLPPMMKQNQVLERLQPILARVLDSNH